MELIKVTAFVGICVAITQLWVSLALREYQKKSVTQPGGSDSE